MQRIVSSAAADRATKMVQEHPLNARLLVQYDVNASNFGTVLLNEMSRLSPEEKRMIAHLATEPTATQDRTTRLTPRPQVPLLDVSGQERVNFGVPTEPADDADDLVDQELPRLLGVDPTRAATSTGIG